VHASTAQVCSAPQVLPQLQKYKALNSAICEGYSSLEAGRISNAIKTFESASRIDLWEEPNYYIFGYLALAYAKQGDIKKAKEFLAKDEIAQLYGIGAVRCASDQPANQGPFYLIEGARRLQSTKVNGEMTELLCQEPYGTNYDNITVDGLVAPAKRLLWHEAIRVQIEAYSK
jgi:tetratricopeptide (TPR) repeat protein